MEDTILNRNAAACLAGVVLAGGRSRRMGGGMKALQSLGRSSLLQHVIDRLSPQVARLYLSVEEYSPELGRFGLEQVPDPQPGSKGPLAGLLAGLARAAEDGYEWLLLAPCDAPFLPPDLAIRLFACAEAERADVAVVRHASRLQPTFSLWGRTAREDIRQAVEEAGMAGFMQFLARRRHAVLDWRAVEGEANPFFNINDPVALAEAAMMIDDSQGK